MELPVFQFIPIASGPVTGQCWKEPGSFFFAPSLQLFICIDKISPEPSILQPNIRRGLEYQLAKPLFIWQML